MFFRVCFWFQIQQWLANKNADTRRRIIPALFPRSSGLKIPIGWWFQPTYPLKNHGVSSSVGIMEKINKKQNSWKINPKFMECHNPFMFQATNQNLTKKKQTVCNCGQSWSSSGNPGAVWYPRLTQVVSSQTHLMHLSSKMVKPLDFPQKLDH